MINKQSLWFVTLFSLIIILGVYYFKSDEAPLSITKLASSETIKANNNNNSDNSLDVIKITRDEATISKISELQDVLLDSEATLEEKNNAYDSLEVISQNKAKETELSGIIKEEFKYDNLVKISDKEINITILNNVHNTEIANSIIRKVSDEYKDNKYITVKFEGK